MQKTDQAASMEKMLDKQLFKRGVTDAKVLAAIRKIPRDLFVSKELASQAYSDQPLPIEAGQTISQPFIVGFMLQALELKATDRVLEIGTGSGYNTALLAELVAEVYSIEISSVLHEQAKKLLEKIARPNIHLLYGDGYRGWPEHGPYDKIILTSAPPKVPLALYEQLKPNGLLLAPEGESRQMLNLYRKQNNKITKTALFPVQFVPMVPG